VSHQLGGVVNDPRLPEIAQINYKALPVGCELTTHASSVMADVKTFIFKGLGLE